MQASDTAAVVLDCSKLNHMGSLPIMEACIKLMNAIQSCTDQKMRFDALTCSSSQGQVMLGESASLSMLASQDSCVRAEVKIQALHVRCWISTRCTRRTWRILF